MLNRFWKIKGFIKRYHWNCSWYNLSALITILYNWTEGKRPTICSIHSQINENIDPSSFKCVPLDPIANASLLIQAMTPNRRHVIAYDNDDRVQHISIKYVDSIIGELFFTMLPLWRFNTLRSGHIWLSFCWYSPMHFHVCKLLKW